MTPVITTHDLTRRYKDTTALDGADVEIQPDVITGLLGRNGAGKTTLMDLLTARRAPSSGTVRVFGADPYENAAVVSRMCFVHEHQTYPEEATVDRVLKAAGMFHPRWDAAFADSLASDFELPRRTKVRKMSTGQRSALGAVLGLASRAEITFFDEPYAGLDAVARQLFYDRLLADYGEHPRTIVLSSHLIDEVAHLLEHVLVIDKGRILMDEPTEDALAEAGTLVGDAAAITRILEDRPILRREVLGRSARVSFLGRLTDDEEDQAARDGLDLVPVSLQELVIGRTTSPSDAGRTADQQGALS
jgi:ABC-2 type transport system ATP-binding protein